MAKSEIERMVERAAKRKIKTTTTIVAKVAPAATPSAVIVPRLRLPSLQPQELVAKTAQTVGRKFIPLSPLSTTTTPTPGQMPAEVFRERMIPSTRGLGGVEVVPGSWHSLQHTYRDADNRPCNTANWIQACMLVFDPSTVVVGEERKSMMLGIEGPQFRCYYPNSTAEDYESLKGAASSGRWVHQYSQRSNYVEF